MTDCDNVNFGMKFARCMLTVHAARNYTNTCVPSYQNSISKPFNL